MTRMGDVYLFNLYLYSVSLIEIENVTRKNAHPISFDLDKGNDGTIESNPAIEKFHFSK